MIEINSHQHCDSLGRNYRLSTHKYMFNSAKFQNMLRGRFYDCHFLGSIHSFFIIVYIPVPQLRKGK